MDYYSVTIRKELLKHTTTWMSQKQPCLLLCYVLLYSSSPLSAASSHPVRGVEEDKVVRWKPEQH